MSLPCPLFGFVVSVRARASTSDVDGEAMRADRNIMLEANGLLVQEATRRAPEYRVTREGGQTTHADRQLLVAWADRWAHIATIRVSALIDLGDDA